MSRLAPVVLGTPELVARVRQGDVMAGAELASKMGYTTVEELLRLVAPRGFPSPRAFDTCCDAIALLTHKD